MSHCVLEDAGKLACMSQHVGGKCPFSYGAGVVVKVELGRTRDSF